jgi:soluble P-type ATPase
MLIRIILINLVKFSKISDSNVTFSDTFPIVKTRFPILKMAYLLVSDTSDTFFEKKYFFDRGRQNNTVSVGTGLTDIYLLNNKYA